MTLEELLAEEFFKVFDERGVDTGTVMPRTLAHATGAWHESALVLIIDEQEQILRTRRASFKNRGGITVFARNIGYKGIVSVFADRYGKTLNSP